MYKMLLFVFSLVNLIYGASFDCNKASNDVETMICNDSELSKLDIELSQKFKAFNFSSNEKNSQKIWLKERDWCKDKTCIEIMYKKRIEELKGANITNYPKLTKVTLECSEALMLARNSFQSTKFDFVISTSEITKNSLSEIVLFSIADDISGTNKNIFRKVSFKRFNETNGNIYWQINAINNHRLVIAEWTMGWRGDMYSVFDIDVNISIEDFISEFSKNENFKNSTAITLDSWKPPLILKNQDSSLWLIKTPEFFDSFGNWEIFAFTTSGVKKECDVIFKPDVKNNVELLSKSVQDLALLLGKTMGLGKDEGTLHPTAQLRGQIEFLLANIVLRPWVFFDEPYNSRKEVDDGLEKWSNTSIKNRKLYNEIKKQYPIAEKSLSNYYQEHFSLSAIKAEALSKYMIDIFFRSHYSFHKNRE